MKINKFIRIILWLAIVLGLQTGGRALGNLVSLNDVAWAFAYNAPFAGSAPENPATFQAGPSSVEIASGAFFKDEYFYACDAILLTGNFATTPGATYVLTCTESGGPYGYGFALAFGSTNVSYQTGTLSGSSPPVSIELSLVATSTSTAIEFSPSFLEGNSAIDFSGLSVVEVPDDVSTFRLLGLGGCAWLLVPRSWRFAQLWKRN